MAPDQHICTGPQVRLPPLRAIQVMAPNSLDYLLSPIAEAFQQATGYKVQVSGQVLSTRR